MAGCGGTGDADGRSSHVSAVAYPVIMKALAMGDRESCDALDAVADKDRVAAILQRFCARARASEASMNRLFADTGACPRGDRECTIAELQRLLREFVKAVKRLAEPYNRELRGALRPGACLDVMMQDTAIFDAAIKQLPEASRRARAGDLSSLEKLLDFNAGPKTDPRPCKP